MGLTTPPPSGSDPPPGTTPPIDKSTQPKPETAKKAHAKKTEAKKTERKIFQPPAPTGNGIQPTGFSPGSPRPRSLRDPAPSLRAAKDPTWTQKTVAPLTQLLPEGLTRRVIGGFLINEQGSPVQLEKERREAIANNTLTALSDGHLAAFARQLLAGAKPQLQPGAFDELIKVLTAQCAQPAQSPLSPSDQGHVDSVLLAAMHLDSPPLTVSNILEKLTPEQRTRFQALVGVPPTRGDWTTFRPYADGMTDTVVRPGTLIRDYRNGGWGFEGVHGEPVVPGGLIPKAELSLTLQDPNGKFPQELARINQLTAGDLYIQQRYAFQSDQVGRVLQDALIAARARGAKIIVAYDPTGSAKSNGEKTDQAFYEKFWAHDIPCLRVPPGVAEGMHDHEKLGLIVWGPRHASSLKDDPAFKAHPPEYRWLAAPLPPVQPGVEAQVDSTNFGSEYTHWLEGGQYVTGPLCQDISRTMLERINTLLDLDRLDTNEKASPHGSQLEANAVIHPFSESEIQRIGQLSTQPVPGAPTDPEQSARFVQHEGGHADRRIGGLLYRAVATSKSEILVRSPYTTDPSFFKQLIRAANPKVFNELVRTDPRFKGELPADESVPGVPDVRVLLPKFNDEGFIQEAARTWYGAMLKAGVQVHEFVGWQKGRDGKLLPSMMHGPKGAIFDGRVSFLGSSNFDEQSLGRNFEADTVSMDPQLAAQRRDEYVQDWAASEEVTPKSMAEWALMDKGEQLLLKGSAKAERYE